MAHQSTIPRGKSWSSGSSGTFSTPPTRWMKNERYLELKQLEQDARNSSNEIKNLEAEICDLADTFEKLKEMDAQRVERLGELLGLLGAKDESAAKEVAVAPSENVGVQEGEGINGQQQEEALLEESDGGDVNEQLESLKSEHEAAQIQILSTKASLEQKRAELEILSGEYKSLTDLIDKEEKLVHTSEVEESLQQSVAVQHEMRSLSEDLGRLGRLMEGLKDSNADQLKQKFTRTQQKPRVYHPVTSNRSRNVSRNFQNGGASDLGRNASLRDPPSSSRSKEPAEFEEREGGGNRKRQKSSTFELERERLHEQRAKLEVEAKEKKRLLESVAGLSSEPNKGASARGLSASSRHILSPSSVFEGFEETPSLGSLASLRSSGPARSGSIGSASASSESSSEFAIEKVDPSLFSAAAKRLDFESSGKEGGVGSGAVVPFPEVITSRSTSEEEFTGNSLEYDEETVRGNSREEPKMDEVESEGSSFAKGEEQGLPLENENEEIQMPAAFSTERGSEEISRPEISSAQSGIKDMQGPEGSSSPNGTEEMQEPDVSSLQGGTEDMQLPEVLSPHNATEEMEEPEVSSLQSGTEDMQLPEVLCPPNGTEEMQEPEVSSVRSGTEDMQGPEVLSSESGTEGMQGPEVLFPESEPDEIQKPGSEEFVDTAEATDDNRSWEETEIPSLRESAEEEVEDIDIPTEEFDSFRDSADEEDKDSREDEIFTPGNEVEEIDIPEEDIENFEGAETAETKNETSELQVLQTEMGIDEVEGPTGTPEGSTNEEDEGEGTKAGQPLVEQPPQLQQNGVKSVETGPSGLQSPPEAGQLQAGERRTSITGDVNERQNWRLEAENQMMQLSSQLSLLQKQVEEEVDLHEKSKNGSQVERSSADKEQLSKQVSFFADEVRGLRQNIDEIQRIVYREGGDLSAVEHWAKDLHSKCADQSAQLEHLGKQVSMLAKDLKHHLKLRVDIDGKLDKQAQERQKVEAQITDLSKALALTVSTIEKEEEAVGELVEQQKHLLVDQLKEAEKLRHIAEVRVETLNNQIEQLEMVCDMAQNIQVVSKYQDKALKYGLQALLQLFLLAVGVITLYSRVAEPLRSSLVPT